MELDLEELWQAIRCRFRHQRSVGSRVKWFLYRLVYRFARRVFEIGAAW